MGGMGKKKHLATNFFGGLSDHQRGQHIISNQQFRLKKSNQPTSKSVRPRMAGVFAQGVFLVLPKARENDIGSVTWVLARRVEFWRFQFLIFFLINEVSMTFPYRNSRNSLGGSKIHPHPKKTASLSPTDSPILSVFFWGGHYPF